MYIYHSIYNIWIIYIYISIYIYTYIIFIGHCNLKVLPLFQQFKNALPQLTHLNLGNLI